MFTGIFVLRIRVCTNIEAGAAEENFVPHIPLVPSVLFTAGTEPCFKTTVYSRIFEFRGKKKVLKRLRNKCTDNFFLSIPVHCCS